MASNKRILNVDTGMRLDHGALALAFECCAVGWKVEGVSVRNLTAEESRVARIRQAEEARMQEFTGQLLGIKAELSGLKFIPPKSTSYAVPREAYEEMTEPLAVLKCKWPRKDKNWPPPEAVNAAIAGLEALG